MMDVGTNLGSKHRDANMTTRVLVRDVMNSPIISSSPDSNIKEIAAKMKTEQANGFMINGYGLLKLQKPLIANSS